MQALFDLVPAATIITMMARYDGVEMFNAKASLTGERNIGSQVEPMRYIDACTC
jgi:hypothetical protein